MPLSSLLLLLVCCGATWWRVAADQAPSDLKIVTRETMFDANGPNALPPFETTYFVKGARIRSEWRPGAGYSRNPKHPNSPTEYTYGPVIATIQQCDTQMGIEINTRDREYEMHPLPRYPTREELKALAASHSKPPEPKEKPKPTVTVERHTVDTGDRKEFFGYLARHVITTTKNIPHQGSRTQPSETVQDGWFIDLKARKSCITDLLPAEKSGGYVAVLTAGLDNRPNEVYELKETGPRENGFPVKVVRTYRGMLKMPDGSTRESVHKTESEVVELSTAPLDPALFEAPKGLKGFKKVDRIDRQPPVPVWARVYMWWERLKARMF